MVARHAEEGATACALLGADPETANYVRYHHTPFDGCGRTVYKCGQDIPIGARILAVADALVAITSERSYQPPRPFLAALRELHRCKGTQFDPDVIEAIPAALSADFPSPNI